MERPGWMTTCTSKLITSIWTVNDSIACLTLMDAATISHTPELYLWAVPRSCKKSFIMFIILTTAVTTESIEKFWLHIVGSEADIQMWTMETDYFWRSTATILQNIMTAHVYSPLYNSFDTKDRWTRNKKHENKFCCPSGRNDVDFSDYINMKKPQIKLGIAIQLTTADDLIRVVSTIILKVTRPSVRNAFIISALEVAIRTVGVG